ncbi:hypothetical protein [Flagellimonas sp.]|uniref:hypothetical protein n=1 Tax=Flagellimonas sp. TaxID=2058762 RepID=UPI003BB04811
MNNNELNYNEIQHTVLQDVSKLDMDLLQSQLSHSQYERLVSRIKNPLLSEKSGISIDHVIGCPLACGYCVRHNFGAFDIKRPYLIESDEKVVARLLNHKYFLPNVTPIKIFSQATDAMVPSVKPHLFNTLKLLDENKLTNIVLIITRFKVSENDCAILNSFKNLRITLLITYSGITDSRIEPIKSSIAIESLKTAYNYSRNYKVILYWRPIIVGLNDSNKEIDFVLKNLSLSAHGIVFTGLRQTNEIKDFFVQRQAVNLYQGFVDRRKIFPDNLDHRILTRLKDTPAENKLYRKTSCGVSAVHRLPDYNGHFVAGEQICNICNSRQRRRCENEPKSIDIAELHRVAKEIGIESLEIDNELGNDFTYIPNLTIDERYFLRHLFKHPILDPQFPHEYGQYGRADKLRDYTI